MLSDSRNPCWETTVSHISHRAYRRDLAVLVHVGPNARAFYWSNSFLSWVCTCTHKNLWIDMRVIFPIYCCGGKNGTARARQFAVECSFYFSSPHLHSGALLKASFPSSCECDQFTQLLNGKVVRETCHLVIFTIQMDSSYRNRLQMSTRRATGTPLHSGR